MDRLLTHKKREPYRTNKKLVELNSYKEINTEFKKAYDYHQDMVESLRYWNDKELDKARRKYSAKTHLAIACNFVYDK